MSMNTIVHRNGGRVWLEGVKGWSPAEKHSSVHAAQEAIMQAVGEKVAYDCLVGVSGLAFRLQVSKSGLCPSSAHPFCGWRCVARSTESVPWHVQVFELNPADGEQVKTARRAVVDSIERGVPVQYGEEEDGVIIGYQREGAEWLCLHPMHDGGQEEFVETELPWGLGIYTGPKPQRASRRELAVEALRQATTMAGAFEAESYYVGFKAWEEYLGQLRAMAAEDHARQQDILGNAWIYACLAGYRRSAALYLREVAGEFAPAAAERLTNAASLYERMSGEVLTDPQHKAAAIAPFPWNLKPGQPWSAGQRQEQIRRLECALPLEREAIAHLEQATALAAGSSQ